MSGERAKPKSSTSQARAAPAGESHSPLRSAAWSASPLTSTHCRREGHPAALHHRQHAYTGAGPVQCRCRCPRPRSHPHHRHPGARGIGPVGLHAPAVGLDLSQGAPGTAGRISIHAPLAFSSKGRTVPQLLSDWRPVLIADLAFPVATWAQLGTQEAYRAQICSLTDANCALELHLDRVECAAGILLACLSPNWSARQRSRAGVR
jgi:hypothetical protein